jgi:hypothetical protein
LLLAHRSLLYRNQKQLLLLLGCARKVKGARDNQPDSLHSQHPRPPLNLDAGNRRQSPYTGIAADVAAPARAD